MSRGGPPFDGRELRLGVLYPGYAGEDDYARFGQVVTPGFEAHIAHVTWGLSVDPSRALKELGDLDRLLADVDPLRAFEPDVVVWACTSASFLWGVDGARQQASGLADAFGVPATSASLAYLDALTAMGIGRVAIGSIYQPEVGAGFVEFLGAGGVETVNLVDVAPVDRADVFEHPERRGDVDPATRIASWGLKDFLDAIDRCDTPAADAVLIPDTAFRVADILDDLEDHAGKPVLMSNQVTVWSALRLVGRYRPLDGFGRLFQLPS